MSPNALLRLWYAQDVSGTSMPIIRSLRLYVCYYRLWCAVLGCWLSGVRCRAAGCESRKTDAAGLCESCSIPLPGLKLLMMGIECPKHVERIISAIKHSVTSSWFFFSTQRQQENLSSFYSEAHAPNFSPQGRVS
jgi:hypothetical protein